MRKIVSHSRMYLERERERKEDYDDEDGWMDGRQNSSRKAKRQRATSAKKAQRK
jgi:hypothetical protein